MIYNLSGKLEGGADWLWEKVCDVSDVPEGTMNGFTVKNAYILLANVDGDFYAVTAVCPHMGGYIPIGVLDGKIIKVSGARLPVRCDQRKSWLKMCLPS